MSTPTRRRWGITSPRETRVARPPAPPVAAAPPPPPPAPAPPAPPPGPTFAGPLESALRHPFLFLLVVLLAAGGAVAYGLQREPLYTAEANLNVGRANVPAYALQGVLTGNATLAAGYARTASAEPVVARAAARTGVPVADARRALSATPVPGSTVIQVESELADRGRSIALANEAARALVAYVDRLNRSGPDGNDLLDTYRSQLRRVALAEDRVERLRRRKNPDADAIALAERDEAVARLKASTVGNQYRSARGTSATETSMQLVAPAASATSDRTAGLQRVILIGVGAGLVLAFAFVLLVTNRKLLGRRRA